MHSLVITVKVKLKTLCSFCFLCLLVSTQIKYSSESQDCHEDKHQNEKAECKPEGEYAYIHELLVPTGVPEESRKE